MASGYPNIGTGDKCVYFVDKTYLYFSIMKYLVNIYGYLSYRAPAPHTEIKWKTTTGSILVWDSKHSFRTRMFF